MLNGKFYTGLPPNMMNRHRNNKNNNNVTKDHQQSNFFWPDDTDTESAVETRVRRRASLSSPPGERPEVVQKKCSPTLSTADERDEVNTKQRFHKEFAKSSINFNDNLEEVNGHNRRSLLRNAKHREITQKPTAMRFAEVPTSDTDTAAIKKKHVYDSKVEFYDFVNDNKVTKKIDMNDKRDVERNSKNSPKLQQKNTLNNYLEQTNRDSVFQEDYKKPNDEEEEDDEEEKNTLRKSRAKSLDAKRRQNIYRRDQTPKRITKKSSLSNGVDYSQYPECRDDFLYDSGDSLSETMTNVQINGRRPAPRKRVTYSEEEEEIPVNNYYSSNKSNNIDIEDDLYKRKSKTNSIYSEVNSNNNNRRPQHERFNSTDGHKNADLNVEQPNKNISNKQNNELEENRLKMSTTSKVVNNNWSMSTENRLNNEKQKSMTNSAHNHLRSSLCFYNGEIVASDNEAANAAAAAPNQQRRNARNAATKRVSVGLPD